VPSQRADLERGFIGSYGMVQLEEIVISTFIHVASGKKYEWGCDFANRILLTDPEVGTSSLKRFY
jgi:hypothetical protein